MAIVTVEKNRYTSESLYQWDKNQTLEIYGLSLASIPEIHFTNAGMDRAIVRQASMDELGIITVEVPNSMLQKSYDMSVYVCVYNGETFETLYNLVVPVDPRAKPLDYTLETDDDEVYSFNKLENQIANILVLCKDLDEVVNTCTEASNNIAQYEEAIATNRTGLLNLKKSVTTNSNKIEELEETINNLPTSDTGSELLVRNNSINLFDTVEDFSTVVDSVIIAWSKNARQMTIRARGDIESISHTFYTLPISELPEGVNIGDTLMLNISGVTDMVRVQVATYYSDGSSTGLIAYKNSGNYVIKLTENISSINFNILADAGTYSGDTVITLTLQNAPSNNELNTKILAIEDTLNSLSIWEGGSY